MHQDGDDLKRAVGAILLAVLALSLGDALIKKFNASFALWQIFIVRAALAAPVLALAIKLRAPAGSLLPRHSGWAALRSLLLVFMWMAYYASLPHLQLSAAAAVWYTAPIFITLLTALLLGGKVGVRGWSAVFIGFAGVLLVLQPRADDFNLYALLPLLTSILYALAMLITRTKCRSEDPLVLAFALNLAFIAVGALAMALVTWWGPGHADANPFLLGGWTAMGAEEWCVLALLSLLTLIGAVFAVIAYQFGPPPVVAAFDFAYLLFAVFWGVLFFADTPGLVAVIGMVLIIAAGLLALGRRR